MDTFDKLPPILRRVIATARQQIDVPSVAKFVRAGHDPKLIAAALLKEDDRMTAEIMEKRQ